MSPTRTHRHRACALRQQHGLSRSSAVTLPAASAPSPSTETPAAAESPEAPACGDGLEPAPCTPEALALLAEKGIAPRAAAGEPLGPDDERFSPVAVGHLTHRLVEVKRMLEQLGAEQRELQETLRLAHLRGDLLHLLRPPSEGGGYQLPEGPLLHRRPGRRQWHYSPVCSELEAQLKARQTYEQATGAAHWSYGAAFWEVRFTQA